VTPCSVTVGYQRFGGQWCLYLQGTSLRPEDGGSKVLRNVGNLPQHYRASQTQSTSALKKFLALMEHRVSTRLRQITISATSTTFIFITYSLRPIPILYFQVCINTRNSVLWWGLPSWILYTFLVYKLWGSSLWIISIPLLSHQNLVQWEHDSVFVLSASVLKDKRFVTSFHFLLVCYHHSRIITMRQCLKHLHNCRTHKHTAGCSVVVIIPFLYSADTQSESLPQTMYSQALYSSFQILQ
jgi:hypothetical protein